MKLQAKHIDMLYRIALAERFTSPTTAPKDKKYDRAAVVAEMIAAGYATRENGGMLRLTAFGIAALENRASADQRAAPAQRAREGDVVTRPNYEHVLEVPEGLRFDTTPETTGKAIEVAFGGAPRSGPAYERGAPFMRTRNVATGSQPTFFRLAQEDGRSGARAFEGAKAADAEKLNAKRRARCACGKPRRQKATACQGCLDHEEAERRAKEPPARWARHWRADGWLCIFREGQVILTPLMKADGPIAYTTAIDNGRWAYAVSVLEQPWRMLSAAEYSQLAPLFAAIRRDCYCSSFPDTGCDFCNGMRLPDGAKEI